MVLSIIQKSYLPTARLLFEIEQNEQRFMRQNTLQQSLFDFFVVPLVAPPVPKILTQSIVYGKKVSEAEFSVLHFGQPLIKEFSLVRLIAIFAWITLFIYGALRALFLDRNIVCAAMIVFLVFQLVLHTFYGDSPFLYSAHFVPTMVLLGGYGLAGMRGIQLRFSTFILFLVSIAFAFLNFRSLLASFGVGMSYMALNG